MRRALLAEPKRFILEQVRIPEPKPDEVIVKVERAGICGSDVHIYHGVSRIQPPLVLGHEISGTIHAIGSGTEGVQVGDRVAVEPGVHCGKCTYCVSGRYNLCASQYTIGGWSGHDGAYADYVRIPAQNLFPLPEGMSYETGAMIEPVACAMHALDLAHISPGDNVFIFGSGTMGLLVAQAVRLSGAQSVAVADVVPQRLTLAKRLGVDEIANPTETDLVAWVTELYGEGGINRVIDTVTRPETFDLALKIVRRGGRIINVGVPTQSVNWGLRELLREIELTGMNMYVRRNFNDAVAAITSGAIHVEPLVSSPFPLAKIGEAYTAVLHEQDRVVKVMLAPQMG